MVRRALLTEREREVLRGDADDVEDLERYQSKVKSRLKNRVPRLLSDLELLDSYAPEVSEEIREDVCPDADPRAARIERLESQVERLQAQVDDVTEADDA